jgi:ATP-dependent DNA ligase
VAMPDNTIIDGEVVALGADARPSFKLLQNYSSGTVLQFFVFDVLAPRDRVAIGEPLMDAERVAGAGVLP